MLVRERQACLQTAASLQVHAINLVALNERDDILGGASFMSSRSPFLARRSLVPSSSNRIATELFNKLKESFLPAATPLGFSLSLVNYSTGFDRQR